MSLVAYDSGSEDSNNEDDGQEQKMETDIPSSRSQSASKANQFSTGRKPPISTANGPLSSDTASASSSTLKFDAILPKPKHSANIPFETDPVPPKKVYGDEESMPKPPGPTGGLASLGKLQKGAGGKVRIGIPSLKDFENDEADEKDRKKIYQLSKKGSGLFAILPEPRLSSYLPPKKQISSQLPDSATEAYVNKSSSNTKPSMPLVPQQTLKRPASPSSANKRLAQVRAKYMKQEIDCIKIVSKKDKNKPEDSEKVPSGPSHRREDSDEDEEGSSDFFSLDSSVQDDETVPMDTDRVPSPVFFSADRLTEASANDDERLPAASFSAQPSEQPDDDIMQYIHPNPKKAKRGGTNAPVNIIDINADDLRPQSTEWLKAISDTSMVPPRKVNLPGGLSKRKHQITYLAAEAKAREEELQNQWAANRHAKRQTQSKYGF